MHLISSWGASKSIVFQQGSTRAQLQLGLPGDCTILGSHALRGRQTGILPLSVFGVSGNISTSPDR